MTGMLLVHVHGASPDGGQHTHRASYLQGKQWHDGAMHLKIILLTLFGWPAGIVLGNLLASIAWVPVQWAGVHLRLESHLREVRALLDTCPNCGHRRSAPDLLPEHDSP